MTCCAACHAEITDTATMVTTFTTVRREGRGGLVSRKVARTTHDVCPAVAQAAAERAAAIEAIRAMPAGAMRDIALRAMGIAC